MRGGGSRGKSCQRARYVIASVFNKHGLRVARQSLFGAVWRRQTPISVTYDALNK